MSWNPAQYLKFGGERLRPAQDLLARVPLDAPARIADLGCGTGTVTALIRARWPDAAVTGVDNSAPMLERARDAVPGVEWQVADLARWTPAAPLDLIVSNAALHWVDGHETLFVRLCEALAPGGVLAVQMPAQHEAPSHQIAFALAAHGPWQATLAPLVRRRPILEAREYFALLHPRTRHLDLWHTEYLQVLTGENPVAEFTKGSFVGVWLAALPDDDAAAFEREYRARIAAAYPRSAAGTTLFPFRRFFLVAQRG